ncbi:MAG: ATPase domain-containing protein, partial [Pseudomonadota bacterium]
DGGLGRALGFLKKRTGNFSPYPRRFSISSEGVQLHDDILRVGAMFPGLPKSEPQTDHGPSR